MSKIFDLIKSIREEQYGCKKIMVVFISEKYF